MSRYWLILILPILTCSCERTDRTIDDISGFFRLPPVEPVARTIKISSTIGYCASVALAAGQGYTIPDATVIERNGHTLVYLHPDHEFPFPYLNEYKGEIVIVSLKIDEEVTMMNLFFSKTFQLTEGFRLYNIETIPIMYEEDRITAVYAGNDINVRNDVCLEISMDPAWINVEISRLNIIRTETEEVAIDQNAWIVDVYHKGTPGNLSDDNYLITGGQQKVEVGNYTFESSTSVLQMAMIETTITSECTQNPPSGFAILREVDIQTSSDNRLKDLVLGTVFFTFHEECDGMVKVPLATGNFITSIGKEYKLGLYE